jgi:chromosome segregation protein
VKETEALLSEREAGISSHRTRIEELARERDAARQRLAPLRAEADGLQAQLEQVRAERQAQQAELATLEARQREQRAYLDALHERKSQADIQLAEQRLRHQNQVDRIAGEYRLGPDEVMNHPEPTWEQGGPPDHDVLETTVGELRAKLDSMGPVNLVAIEEHRELEERYAFLTQQQDDLVKAKQQLLDLIRKINRTTTEMFSSTFHQVNENFQVLFKQLFGGGTAKLVLVDEEDVLESGIEIIARPPGKKLQTVSLLSGGERTMTAVALLFSLYMVKPSPFCMLDELDAALDEANIGRFVEMLQGFLKNSQFVVITHNRRTIGASDVLYGITMEKQGVSSIVSVRLADHAVDAPA